MGTAADQRAIARAVPPTQAPGAGNSSTVPEVKLASMTWPVVWLASFDSEANAHRPSGVPTIAVGAPGTVAVTGRGADKSVPDATCVEQPTLRVAASLRATRRCGRWPSYARVSAEAFQRYQAERDPARRR